MIMKEFKGRSDVDMSVVSKIAKSILPWGNIMKLKTRTRYMLVGSDFSAQ
jgi:hypothetical protein